MSHCKPKRTCGPKRPTCRKAPDNQRPAGCGFELFFIVTAFVGIALWCGCGGILLKLLGV